MFLLFLADHLYSQQFGSFLANSERHRDLLRLKSRTVSVWSYVNHPSQLRFFLNPIYSPTGEKVLPVSASPAKILFWEALYNRSETSQDAASSLYAQLVSEIVLLRSKIGVLETSNAKTF